MTQTTHRRLRTLRALLLAAAPLSLVACGGGASLLTPPPPMAETAPPAELRQAPRYELPPEMSADEVFGPGFDREGNPLVAQADQRQPRPALDGGYPNLGRVPARPDDLPSADYRRELQRALESGEPLPPEPGPEDMRRFPSPNGATPVPPIGRQSSADRPDLGEQFAEAAALDPMRRRVAEYFEESGGAAPGQVAQTASPAGISPTAEADAFDPMRQRFLERFGASGRSAVTDGSGAPRLIDRSASGAVPQSAPQSAPLSAPRPATPAAQPQPQPQARPAAPATVQVAPAATPAAMPTPAPAEIAVRPVGRIAFAAGADQLDAAALDSLTRLAGELPTDGRVYLIGSATAEETADPQALARTRVGIVGVALSARGIAPNRLTMTTVPAPHGGAGVEIGLDSSGGGL